MAVLLLVAASASATSGQGTKATAADPTAPVRANAASSATPRIEIVPHIGMYVAIGVLVDEPTWAGDDLRMRQVGAGMVGTRIAYRTAGPIDVEASVSYSPGLIAVTDASSTVDQGGEVMLANVRAVWRLSDPVARGRWGLHLSSGVGVVRRSGAAWRGTDGTTDPAITVGGGARFGLVKG
ncbi:MAG: hypothetical protein ACREIV_00490, partial [Planctomycetaceae bacterium]